MQWEGREQSSSVEDRRGLTKRDLAVGGGAIGVVVLVIAGLLDVDPQWLAQFTGQDRPAQQRQVDPQEERHAAFTKVILRDTEIVWAICFRR